MALWLVERYDLDEGIKGRVRIGCRHIYPAKTRDNGKTLLGNIIINLQDHLLSPGLYPLFLNCLLFELKWLGLLVYAHRWSHFSILNCATHSGRRNCSTVGLPSKPSWLVARRHPPWCRRLIQPRSGEIHRSLRIERKWLASCFCPYTTSLKGIGTYLHWYTTALLLRVWDIEVILLRYQG